MEGRKGGLGFRYFADQDPRDPYAKNTDSSHTVPTAHEASALNNTSG